MSKFWNWILWALLPAASAAAAQIPPPLPMTTVIVSNDLEIAPAAPLTMPPPPLGMVAPAQPVTPQKSWPTNWVNAWIPLESWGKYNGLEKLTVVKSNPHPTYQFVTESGAIALKLGTRVALVNGLECWLGHAPQIIKGIACVHWLDAQKNLQPLLAPLQFPPQAGRTIVIDPGHGGIDSGTKSAFNSRYEKEYVLDWAQRLSRVLEANGWKVVMTRTRDVDVSLNDRILVADRANADLFVSLHFNSGLPNRELSGIETYCLSPAGMPSSLLRSQEDDLRQAYRNNAFDEQNFILALQVHGSVLQETAATDRGVRRARFMSVLRGQNRPAVLIEGGYLSNYNEAKTIATADYRQKLAEGLARAIVAVAPAFIGTNETASAP